MRLHGNAELSLNKRRRLVGRVENEGWTVRKAASMVITTAANTSVTVGCQVRAPNRGRTTPEPAPSGSDTSITVAAIPE